MPATRRAVHPVHLIVGVSLTLAFVLFLMSAARLLADVTTRGQIEGKVRAEDGTALPGATATLSGSALVTGSAQETSNAEGVFRFVNLNPGDYRLRVEQTGFLPREYALEVRVGKTVSLDVLLVIASISESVTVEAVAPLFDQTSAAHGTNMDDEELQSLPTSRDFISLVDSAAGFNNQAAYGAGGNVADYDAFGYGAATNSYQLNGVSVSNLEFGNSWVNPNYDTIQEIQIVGPGGTAEYSSYSGAVVNVVTKGGTDEFSGTLSSYYTNDELTGDNSAGIADLEPGIIDRDRELSLTLGGAIVKNKLHFFTAGGYHDSATAPPSTSFYDDLDRRQYQIRLDYVPSFKHSLTAMLNHEPIRDEDLGFQVQTGPEVGYFREQETTTGFVSWLGAWSNDLISEVRYAGVSGYHDRIPNTLEKARVADASSGVIYNSQGFIREQENQRDEARAVVTHYVADFFGASHELKGGVEYEKAETATRLSTAENVLYSLIPLGPGLTYVQAIVNYNVNQVNDLDRKAAFVQDRATFGRATVSLGARFDRSETSDTNTGEKLLSFDQLSPRLGLAYDLRGNGRSVVRVGAGRYYDKVPTYGIGSYAGTGLAPVSFYGYVSTDPIDPTNTAQLRDVVIRPENFSFEFATELMPVEDGIRGPHTDILNLGFDQQIGTKTALSFNYMYRESTDFIVLTQHANDVTYEPIDVTSEFTGRTFTIYRVTGGGPRELALGNRDFNWQKTHFAVAELRWKPMRQLFLDASLALERSRGTRDNNECAILSLCSAGVDKNPNYVENDFYTKGALSQERPWTLKVRGNWELPRRWNVGWDVRWMAGRPYGAVDYCFNVPGCNDDYLFTVLLEPKDARREENAALLNLRLAKAFSFRGVETTVSLDALNLTNETVNFSTYALSSNINDIYALESLERGEVVSAFGRPSTPGTPRQFRFGVRVAF